MDEEMITITKKEYDSLVEDSNSLNALREAELDSWEDYCNAQEIIDG